jgi:hypothetical protein
MVGVMLIENLRARGCSLATCSDGKEGHFANQLHWFTQGMARCVRILSHQETTEGLAAYARTAARGNGMKRTLHVRWSLPDDKMGSLDFQEELNGVSIPYI